ncbi:hypothetical protein ACJQWK_00356 [Exserohilum turcicum]
MVAFLARERNTVSALGTQQSAPRVPCVNLLGDMHAILSTCEMLLFRDDPYCHFLGLGIQSTVLGLGRTAPQARRTRRSAIHPAKTAKNHIPPTRLSRCSFVSPLCSCAKAPVRLRTTQTCNSTTRISLRQTRADAIDRHAPSQDTPCILDLVLIAVKTRILPLKLSCSHTLPFL